MKNWFNGTFRKIHLAYSAPLWAENNGEKLNIKEYVLKLKDANIDCVELFSKDHGGMCYFKSSSGLVFPIDILGEFIKEAYPLGIKVLSYFSVSYDNYAVGQNPDWCAIDQKGRRQVFDPANISENTYLYNRICLNSPYYQYALKQLEEISRNYEVDGFWLDIIPIAYAYGIPGDPVIIPFPVPCYCNYCQRDYIELTGKELPKNPTPSEIIEIFKWMSSVAKSFLEECYKVVRKYRPNALVFYNGSDNPGDPIHNAEVVCMEAAVCDSGHSIQSFRSRWSRGCNKPFELITGTALSSYFSWDVKPVNIFKLESAITLAHGGGMTAVQIPYPDGSVENREMELLKEVFSWVKTIESYIVNTDGVKDICLLCLDKARSAPHRWFDMYKAVENVHLSLLDGHFQYGINKRIDNLQEYPLVIIPDQQAMSDQEIEEIRTYVENGGNLIVSGLTSLYDEEGMTRDNFGLSDVIGADFVNKSEYSYCYLQVEDQSLNKEIADTKIRIHKSPIKIKVKTAEVLGKMFYPYFNRSDVTTIIWGSPHPNFSVSYPGILLNQYGKGSCLYISTFLDCHGMKNIWSKKLLNNIVDKMLFKKVLKTDAPPGVEIVLNKQGNRYILHLINYYACNLDSFSFSGNKIMMKGVKVTLDMQRLGKIEKIFSLSSDEVVYQIKEKELEITVPDFEINSIIVLE